MAQFEDSRNSSDVDAIQLELFPFLIHFIHVLMFHFSSSEQVDARRWRKDCFRAPFTMQTHKSRNNFPRPSPANYRGGSLALIFFVLCFGRLLIACFSPSLGCLKHAAIKAKRARHFCELCAVSGTCWSVRLARSDNFEHEKSLFDVARHASF